jgi:Lipocalin-like domain
MKTLISALTILAGLTVASSGKAATLADELVGTWAVTEAATHEANGATSYPYGRSPKGTLIFTKDGYFAQIMSAGDIPKFASNNRTNGTADEYKAVVQKSLAFFGTYSVDEATKSITYKVEASTFPNWDGSTQVRSIVVLNANEFVYRNPSASAGGVAENRYRREGK